MRTAPPTPTTTPMMMFRVCGDIPELDLSLLSPPLRAALAEAEAEMAEAAAPEASVLVSATLLPPTVEVFTTTTCVVFLPPWPVAVTIEVSAGASVVWAALKSEVESSLDVAAAKDVDCVSG